MLSHPNQDKLLKDCLVDRRFTRGKEGDDTSTAQGRVESNL